jgi:glutaredoxin
MRKPTLAILLLATLAAAPVQADRVYTWTDPATGKTVFSDQPPPPSLKGQQKDLKNNSIDTSGPGYAMKQAMKNAPVTLFANECGEPCDNARKLLKKRNVPFTLKNPETQAKYADELKKLAGGMTVPVLQIGSKTAKGFEAGQWSTLLDEAGYPQADGSIAPASAPAKDTTR